MAATTVALRTTGAFSVSGTPLPWFKVLDCVPQRWGWIPQAFGRVPRRMVDHSCRGPVIVYRSVIVVALTIFSGICTNLSAQDVAERLAPVIVDRSRQTSRVPSANWRSGWGSLRSAPMSSRDIAVVGGKDRLPVPISDLAPRLNTRRPLWQYTAIGAGIGMTIGAGVAVYSLIEARDDPIYNPYLVVGIPVGVGAVGGGLIGALVGNIVD